MTDAYNPLLTFILTLIGSGIGTAIVAALLKRRFDAQIERLKAVLERGSCIHEHQVDVLMMIHLKLEGAAFYLQRVASPGRFKGEDDNQLLEGRDRNWHVPPVNILKKDCYSVRR